MYLVEKHIIKPSNEIYKILDDLCFKSKNLYNKANYIIR
jgi:putative transposase